MDPLVKFSSIYTLHLHFYSSLFPSLPLSDSLPSSNRSLFFSFFAALFPLNPFFLQVVNLLSMFFSEEEFQYQLPVLETGFNLTSNEIEEVLSMLETRDSSVSPHSGSEGSNRAVYSVDERKKRRMLSNRESARRSRWRKKRHVENLTEEVNRLKVENRELKNQYSFILNKFHLLWRDNERLTSEYVALWARLSNLCQILSANPQ